MLCTVMGIDMRKVVHILLYFKFTALIDIYSKENIVAEYSKLG